MDNINDNLNIKGEWSNDKHSVKVEVPVMFFTEDDMYYAYIPALDVTGYGNSEEEAKKSLEVSLSEFFRYTLNKNTFSLELQRLGWNKTRKMYKAPEISSQLMANEQLRDIVNNKEYRTSTYDVAMPAFA